MKKLPTLLILTLISTFGFSKTITVTSSADSGLGTLRQAVLDASPNDSIVFDKSITTVTLTSYVIALNKNITIIGDSITTTTILATNSRHFVLPDMTGIGNPVIATLKYLTLRDGYYYTCGGSIFSRKGNTLEINNCFFINNKSGEFSAAIENAGILRINNSLFKGNSCGTHGVGAISNVGEIYVNNTIFKNNYGSNVGVIYNYNGGITKLIGCLFEDNVGNYSGLANRGVALIVNCLFISNSSNLACVSNYKIDEIDLKETFLIVMNSTIVNNIGRCIYNNQSLSLYNNIVVNNHTQDIYNDNLGSIVSANNIIGTSNIDLSGNGNILRIDPLFVDTANHNYSLQANSPAIDAGDKTYLPDSITIDILGNVRISSNKIDIGAYEYQSTASSILTKQLKSNIYSIGHTIYVDNTTSQSIKVFNVTGELVAQSKSSEVTVYHSGVYIVQFGDKVKKVIVK